jgi:DNA-binding MarR family transcriptional regulator
MFLWARDGMSQAELSRTVAIEPPTMVRTIDRMVRDGLVKRRPDPRDARISRIHFTNRGRSLRDELVPKTLDRTSDPWRERVVRESARDR